MKKTKKLLSFFLAIVMVITAIPAFTITSNAATQDVSRSISIKNYGVLSSGGRISSNTFELVNDGRNGNFSIGIVKFNISNLTAAVTAIKSATYSMSYTTSSTDRTNNMYIGFYYPTQNYEGTYTLTNGSATSSGTAYSNIFTNTNDTNHTHVAAATSYFGLQKIGEVQANNGVTNTYSLDIASLLKYFLDNGKTEATLMCMLTAYDGTDNAKPWSDRKLTVPTTAFNITCTETVYTTTASSDVNANSSTGRVVLDDAIYTYESESAYYNYGTTISTLDPWDTQVIFKSGSASDIASIICLDSGAALSLNGTNKLQGNLSADKFKVSTADKNVNATLLFRFTDGTQEYHRVAVKSYPVENHIMASSEKKAWNGARTETGFTMFMRGSTGSGGTGVWKYLKSYYTSGTTAHGFPDQNNNTYTSGKKASVFKWVENGEAATDVSLATYYIDKSCKDTSWAGLGNSELWNGSNYTISIDVVRTRFGYDNGTANWNNVVQMVPTNNYTYSAGSRNDTNGTTYPLKYTYNASVTTSQRYSPSSTTDNSCNVRVALRTTDTGYAVIRTNMAVNLFDKSTARSKYDELIRKNLVESNYTASSFATYQNALMAMEAYLSNYENTTAISTSDSIYTALVNAYNGLVPRATESDYQAMVTAYTDYKAVTSNRDNYTTTSYNKFVNDGIWDGDLVTAENGALSIKNQVEADSSAMRDLAKSTCTTYTNKLNEYLNKLVERADFRYYNEQFDAIPGALSVFTAKDGQNIRVYRLLEPYESITLYTDAQKADTPKTSQTTVNNAGSAIANANTNINNSSVEGTDYVDQTALKSFTAKYATCDTDVYKDPAVITTQTNSAKALYKKVTFSGTDYYSLNVANQTDLDNKIKSYLTEINREENIVTYNVTVPSGVSVVVRGATQTPVSGNTYNLICGENATFVNTGNADTAWYMEYTSNNANRGNQYQAYGESFTTKIVGNMTVTAESYATGKNCVSIVREYDKAGTGKAIDRVNFVANGDYTLPTPTKIANYNFAGYVVNGETKAAGDVITITADTEIVAKYQYVGSDLTVTVNGTAKTYAYNQSVSVRASGAYAWVEKTGADTWRPFYIGSAVTFRATESTELKSVTQDEFNAMFTAEAFAPILRQNGVLVDADNRAVFHAQRIDYLPAGAQVVEFGILMNTAYYKKGTPVYDFDLGNDKADGEKNQYTVRMKSTQSLDKVQFNIFAKNAGDKPFTYRSYMIYKLADGTVETVYSDVFTKA